MIISSSAFVNPGLTLKAVSSNGDLIGVTVNAILSRDDAKPNDRASDGAVKFETFMALFEKVGREMDVFGTYPEINRVMDIAIVAVDETFRGRGVCKSLFDKTKYVRNFTGNTLVCPSPTLSKRSRKFSNWTCVD